MYLKRKLKAFFVGFYKQLLSPVLGILWIFTIIIVIPLFAAVVSGRDLFGEVIEFFAIQISFLLAFEVGFRLSYRFKYGGPYKNLVRVPVEKLFVEPHPYLPFVNKKHFLISAGIANYPLHKGRFSFDRYFTNNLRFSNGVDGSRDVVVPKPANLFRINCIGASTTGNYIHYKDTSYSYPLELEKILQSKHGDFIEVNNCSIRCFSSRR